MSDKGIYDFTMAKLSPTLPSTAQRSLYAASRSGSPKLNAMHVRPLQETPLYGINLLPSLKKQFQSVNVTHCHPPCLVSRICYESVMGRQAGARTRPNTELGIGRRDPCARTKPVALASFVCKSSPALRSTCPRTAASNITFSTIIAPDSSSN